MTDQHQAPEARSSEAATAPDLGLIVVTKGNPSRGSGFQVAHFQGMNRLKNLSAFDRFLPTFGEATEWVTAHYPSACVRSIRRNATGVVAGISFYCKLDEIFHSKSVVTGELSA